MTIYVGDDAPRHVTPSPDDLVRLWDEMKTWPPEHAMNFALCLANLAMVELGTHAVDGGVYDGIRGSDVYLVAAAGHDLEPRLRAAVEGLLKDSSRGSFTVKAGARPTPLSGDQS